MTAIFRAIQEHRATTAAERAAEREAHERRRSAGGGRLLRSAAMIETCREKCRTCPHEVEADGGLQACDLITARPESRAPCVPRYELTLRGGTCPLDLWRDIVPTG